MKYIKVGYKMALDSKDRIEEIYNKQLLDIWRDDGGDDLHILTYMGKIEMIKYCLKRGVEVNRRNKSGLTAIAIAGMYGHTDILYLLFKNGGDAEVKDNVGRTAIMNVINGLGVYSKIWELMVMMEKGVDVEMKHIDINGNETEMMVYERLLLITGKYPVSGIFDFRRKYTEMMVDTVVQLRDKNKKLEEENRVLRDMNEHLKYSPGSGYDKALDDWDMLCENEKKMKKKMYKK